MLQNCLSKLICAFFVVISFSVSGQNLTVPFDHVVGNDELIKLLNDKSNPQLKKIKSNYLNGKKEKALNELTDYFKEKLSDRYFFSWKNFNQRFEEYNKLYSGRFEFHKKKAKQHLDLYSAKTEWKIPFTNLKGDKVTSYPYRHLTRQQKSKDIALLYYYTQDTAYLHYISTQAESLKQAFNKGQYETIEDGNGAYESYRAGNRMFNWLFVNQCLLASADYTTQEQLVMLKTFIHTAAKLNHHNQKYREGNHQTRGMSALAMLSMLFKEFKGADQWWQTASNRLEEHLKKEVYQDGFQFERSVHYHIDDIDNYFYPYQMAKLNGIKLNAIWDQRLKGMFDAIVKLAMPNKMVPCLQDDTDKPWSEYNEIKDIMALGVALYSNQQYKYFTSSKIPSDYYWQLTNEQVQNFKSVKGKRPKLKSTDLPFTGYYVMRNGWKTNDLYMVISSGYTKEKAAHQHGDMLGIEAYAFGNMILPNYQVRYYLKDLQEFKNSWTKNVALVDSIPQGQDWKGNKGGSGFGLWGKLPDPKTISWNKGKNIDFFIGSHNGYQNEGVNYTRQVFFIKDGFWLVRDHFTSTNSTHKYQQVWQGHYDAINSKHVRSAFSNGSGLDIIQLEGQAGAIAKATARGKGRIVLESAESQNFTFTTLLYPYKNFDERIEDIQNYERVKIHGWEIVSSDKKMKNEMLTSNAKISLAKDQKALLLDVSEVKLKSGDTIKLTRKSDLLIENESMNMTITNCGIQEVRLSVANQYIDLKPGKLVRIEL